MSLDLGPRPIRLRGGASSHPRRKVRRVLLLALALLLFVVTVGFLTDDNVATQPVVNGDRVPVEDASDVDAVQPAGVPEVFARVEGLELWTPSGATLLVAYHEAAFADALSMRPEGRLRNNFNTTKYQDPGVLPGPIYDIQASRGRENRATTAVDLVLRDDEPVLSPITGRVVEVRNYSLYGRYADTRIEIAAASDPSLRVVLIHVAKVKVKVGDEVVAGQTPLAGTANRFPFHSQVDRHLPDGPWPHVHLEVKRA
ncbi:MAG: M23 family metallopeptidase [Nitriliruptorales bacterium]|nr:M23 family metallopeptidase [Nitriliruptorales bacterium]